MSPGAKHKEPRAHKVRLGFECTAHERQMIKQMAARAGKNMGELLLTLVKAHYETDPFEVEQPPDRPKKEPEVEESRLVSGEEMFRALGL